ncbi:MAG: sensor histidine kinase [bacterium]
MTELFAKNFDLLGMNAVFHLIRLVVLMVVLYMQWRQWHEGRKSEYLLALIAFASLVFTELFIAYFYTSGIVKHLERSMRVHPYWGDFLQSLSLILFALITPYLALSTSQRMRWKTYWLWSTLFSFLVLLIVPKLEFASSIFVKIPHYPNALLSLYAVGFLTWALIAVSRQWQGHCGQILVSLAFLVISQIFHFAFFTGLTWIWFPIHFGERIFSTLGYIVYLTFMHDYILAEKRALLHELQNLNAELRRLDKLKNNFLSLASHELRTPLTVMHTAAALLRKETLSKTEQQRMIEVIFRRSKNLAQLVEECLDISRIQLGKLEYRMKPFPVNDLFRNAMDEIQPLCKEKDILLKMANPETDLMIMGDPDRLLQVLLNLLSNSVKFTPSGGHITLRGFEEGKEVCISVEDTGVGINPEHLPHIFDPFYRADAPDGNSRGVGLGLLIAKSIVEAHSGSIVVKSKTGQGTIFVIYLDRISSEVLNLPGFENLEGLKANEKTISKEVFLDG